MTKYIFITGGVVSSLGKGIASASLGALLQSRGYTVRLRKLDPYLNIDPGTMSPYQHGEVFVTDDGAETDLDLGHYERFTGASAKKGDSVTSGKIYETLLQKERRGDYLGKTVQVIPHVTNLIKDFIQSEEGNADFVLCEIGGTVGDIEALPFCEAIRQLRYELGKENTLYIHLTLVPYIASAKELKTKPTQHSVKELRSIGIQPDILLCRSERHLPESYRKKIALFCNVKESNVLEARDQKHIYNVPLAYHKAGLDLRVLEELSITDYKEADLSKWNDVVANIKLCKKEVNIAIVGKYEKLADSYKSIVESFDHAGISNQCKVNIKWVGASDLTAINIEEELRGIDGIMVPGGFGDSGIEGKIAAIHYARVNKIPFFGICLGMQLAAVEIARNLLNLTDACSAELGQCEHNIIDIIDAKEKNLGGTMRLGAYPCDVQPDSTLHKAYGHNIISERHRHRYEFNQKYQAAFEKEGVIFSGICPENNLVEALELPNHPWFVGVQFHPELKSRPFSPHPLFTSFVRAAINKYEG